MICRSTCRGHAGFVILATLLCTTASGARTWTVEKDGSGDFTVIQDAVDAANDGDTILIGAGRFDEYTTVQNGSHFYDNHVIVREGLDISIQGAGPDATIIGPDDPEAHENDTYGIAGWPDVHLEVRDLAIENCNYHNLWLYSGTLDASNCRFEFQDDYTGNEWGIVGSLTSSCSMVIRDCEFSGYVYGIASIASSGGVTVENCTFDRCRTGIYAWTSDSSNVRIADCTFNCDLIGVGFLNDAGGEILRSDFENCTVSLEVSGAVTMADCSVVRDDASHHGTVYLRNADPVIFENNVFASNGTVIAARSSGLGTFRNNHFLQTGDGYAVECARFTYWHSDLDLSNNYWGTTDVDEIAELIYDCHDTDDAYHCVIFEPLADVVAVEERSWSTVRGLFE